MAPTSLTAEIQNVVNSPVRMTIVMKPAELLRIVAALRATPPGQYPRSTQMAVCHFVRRAAMVFPAEITNLLLDGSRDPAEESMFFRE